MQVVKPDRWKASAWSPDKKPPGYDTFKGRMDDAVSGFWENFWKKSGGTLINFQEIDREVVNTMTSEMFDETALRTMKALLVIANEYEDPGHPFTECKHHLEERIEHLKNVSHITECIMHNLFIHLKDLEVHSP